MARVAVFGIGYVGLTSAACLAHLGHTVIAVDIDERRVEDLRAANIPILEDGLPELVREGTSSGRLTFTTNGAEAVAEADSVFLCVPTPQDADGSADVGAVLSVARDIGPLLVPDATVVLKSTVPVGTSLKVARILARSDVHVVNNPEFLREGSAVHDFLHPDRLVIGATDIAAARRVEELYLGLNAPAVITDPASAELIKYASNAFLATKISYINAISAICESVGADVQDVALGMGYDKRIGFEFLKAGPGWGGSCFPKDSSALIHTAAQNGYRFALLEGVVEVNQQQLARLGERIAVTAKAEKGAHVAVWGLTFKARTDDLRDSPSLAICAGLLARGIAVRAYDPTVSLHRPRPGLLPDALELAESPLAAVTGASVLVVLTEWDEFRWVDLERVAHEMAGRSVIDGRNLLDPAAVRRSGLNYHGVGRV